MQISKLALTGALALLCGAGASLAGSVGCGADCPATRNEVYLGLRIALSGTVGTPSVVLGARSVRVQGDGMSWGADLSLRLGVGQGLGLDSAVASVVGGREDLLANAGLGWSFGHARWMDSEALQTGHLRAAADWVFTLAEPDYAFEFDTLAPPRPKTSGGHGGGA